MVELKERLQGEIGREFSLSLNNGHSDVVRYRDKQVHVHFRGATDGGHQEDLHLEPARARLEMEKRKIQTDRKPYDKYNN